MTRRRFGGDLTSVAWSVEEVSGTADVVVLARDATNITAWDSRSGGVQITDLTDLSETPLAGGVITADANGMFTFLGPDTTPDTVELYLDTGLGDRQLIGASDLGPDIAAAKATADAANAYTDTQLVDAPRFIVYSAGWAARNTDARLTIFSGGDVAVDAPTDVNLKTGDIWIPAT